MPIWVSLAVIAAVAGGAIGASVWHDRRVRRRLRDRHRHEEQLRERDDRRPAAEPRGPVRT